MADISVYLANILAAVYGEDVRGSIHDAIELINDVSEVVLTTGTAVNSASSSSTGFYDGSLYLNTSTYELWKCTGTDTWASQGVLRGASGAAGADGNKWYRGLAISGKAANPTVYSGSGITDANPNDFYLNPSEGAIYYCVTGGDAATATWSYDFTMSGGGGSGDIVTWTQIVGTGTKIAEIDINGSSTDVYAPTGGGATALSGLSDVTISTPADNQFLRYDGAAWVNEAVTIPSAANDATLTIQQNGTTAGTFTANASVNATANITTDAWFGTTTTVSSGAFSFSGLDDTQGYAFEPYFEVTGASTNKNPTAQISTITGSGTSSMTISYTTDADEGATVYLRIIK